MSERRVKPGELLAMSGTRLHHDRKGFFWLMGGGPLPNERKGDVVLVHARGELEHHKDPCAESYEGIVEKMRAAYAGESEDEEAAPPKAIALVIDSPGGVVSGLVACVEELQRMRAEHPEIKVSCYVDEMAASAAYALACSCDEIVCPPSAILGSIGVISTMISATVADKKAGFDVRLITSGARKADGHMHAPLTDAAIQAETTRVEKLAAQFFRLAGKARKLSIDKIRSFQAGIFLGKDAIRVGLADRLGPVDAILVPIADGSQENSMDLAALIKSTKAALATEDDPAKLRELSAALGAYSSALEAYKKTEKFTEKVKTEEGDDDKEEDDEKDDGEDAKSEAAASDDEAESEDAEKSKKALATLAESLTGMTGGKALGALRALAATAAQASKDVAALRVEGTKRDKAALIAGAKGKYLTAKEAAWLGGQKMSVVEGFVEMRRKSGVIVHTDETTILKPKDATPGTEESLPQTTRDMIDQAVAAMPAHKKEKGRAELVAAHLKSHDEQISRALNGAAEGRY